MKYFIFCSFCLLVGCATLEKGTHERMDFASELTNSDVYVNGELLGTTPVTLKLESKETYRIEFKKNGLLT